MTTYSLFELNEYIRRVVALNFQEGVWVHCEIAQISSSRGHFYLNIVEKAIDSDRVIAQSSAILWASKYRQLKRNHKTLLDKLLSNGTEVLVQVKIDFDERYGLKLLIDDIDPSYTIGKLALKRQEILKTLVEEKLLEKNKSLPLPEVLQCVAVISSETAAGLQDYLDQLATNAYGYRIKNQLFQAAMQGDKVEKEVLRQLKRIALIKENFDAVVIIRGGGAKLDLAAFDNLLIARTIANFPLPVLIGIGHEVDETILDKVAHTSLKTPTAVADFLVHQMLQFESNLMEKLHYVKQHTSYQIQEEKSQLDYLQKISLTIVKNLIKEHQIGLSQIQKRIPTASINLLKLEHNTLHNLEKSIRLLDPKTALKRGFSITTMENGKVVTDKKQVTKGDILITQLLQNKITSTVK